MIYGRGKPKLPKFAVVCEDDDSCITVESSRYSSKPAVVFRVVQRFFVVDNEDSHAIAFWTVFQDEVPSISNIANDAFFGNNHISVVNDSYSERGNIVLSALPHDQTRMVQSIEIGYNLELIKDVTAAKLIEAKLDMTRIANVFFDRSEEVDAMVLEHFVSAIMPKLELTRIRFNEKEAIEKCKIRLGLGDESRGRIWERVSETAKDKIESFIARDEKGRVYIKRVAKVDEKSLLPWLG